MLNSFTTHLKFFIDCKNFLLWFITLLLIACGHTKNIGYERQLPEKKIGTNANEIKLGNSKFYLIVPDDFKVIEAKGKEGQHGFHILPKKTTSKMFGFIEIEHGPPISNDSVETLGNIIEYVSRDFLNVQIKWTIYRSQSGYFDAETPTIRGISASALSKKRSEIDSLISIIETLTEK